MENERYSLEKAQEEATELQKKVESGEASDYVHAEKQLESAQGIEAEANPLSRPASEQIKTIFGIEGRKHDSAIEKEIEQSTSAITDFLKSRLIPRTYHLSSPRTNEEAEATEGVLKTRIPGYIAKASKDYSLFNLGSLSLGKRIDKENVEAELKQAFKDKRVLILGDDIGGLSEMINLLGGTAYGLEYDREKVKIAHSGVLAESGKPQTQVIEGNIADLTDPDSELLKKLEQLGPFDAIYSDAVFNSGSGIESARNPYYQRKGVKKDLLFMGKILDTTDNILSENGVQFHENIDGSNADILTSRVQEKKHKAILDEYGLEFRVESRALLTKKGLMKQLMEADPSSVMREHHGWL